MEISKLEVVAARGGHRFRVFFDCGATVEVSAAELQSYAKFQRRVLEETGKHYRFAMAEYARVGRMEWSSWVGILLARAQAAGAPPTPQEE